MSLHLPPRVGDTVHYTSYGTPGGEYESVCRAAIVAEEVPDEDALAVVVLNPSGVFFNTVRRGRADEAGTWHPVGEECSQ